MQKNRMDKGRKLTDEQLAELEARIRKMYNDSAQALQEIIDDYFDKFAARDKEMRAMLDAGKIDEEKYKQWRLAQIGRGKRFEALRDKLADRTTHANEVAVSYINDATPGIYSLNRNYAAYELESAGAGIDFTLYDETTVRRLIVEQPDLMPYYPPKKAVNRGIDLDYGRKVITSRVTSGILMGESNRQIAAHLRERITSMSIESAIRAARTATTAAENGGRSASYKAAADMGVKMTREWIATHDAHTRPEHGHADGQRVGIDEPFLVGGEKLMFPGDSSLGAHGWNIYNCRCAIKATIKGHERSRETWEEWREKKEKEVANAENNGILETPAPKAKPQKPKIEYNGNKMKEQLAASDTMEWSAYYEEAAEQKRLEDIKRLSNLDDKTATNALHALCGDSQNERDTAGHPQCYFYGANREIRKRSTPEFAKMADDIDNYIVAAPKYEGKVYRGIAMDEDFVSKLTAGREFVDDGSLSSWSSKKTVAQRFGKDNSQYKSGMVSVVLELENPSYGTPVQHLSVFGTTEAEVLVSNMHGTKYTISKITKTGGTQKTELVKQLVSKGKTEVTYTDEYNAFIAGMKKKYGTDDYYSQMSDAEFDMQQKFDTPVEYGGGLIVKKTEDVWETVKVPVGKASPVVWMIKLKEK